MNKISILLFTFLISSNIVISQNSSVGIGTKTPDNSAILDLVSFNQGFLPPRQDSVQITTISSPTGGLLIYNIQDSCYWYKENSVWGRLCNTDKLLTLINNLGDTVLKHTTQITNLNDSIIKINNQIINLYDSILNINNNITRIDSTLLDKWDIWGNTGTNANINFLGTTDNIDLVFRTNNIEKTRLLTNGNFGIGTNVPTELLDINSTALRLRNGATKNYVLTTDSNGVGTWKNPATNPLVSPLGNDWKLKGNSGTNTFNDFLGTIDNVDLVLRTNNKKRLTIKNDGTFYFEGQGTFTSVIPALANRQIYLWNPGKVAFRGGYFTGGYIIQDSIGVESWAYGVNVAAIQRGAFVFGRNARSNNKWNTTFGNEMKNDGQYAFTAGFGCIIGINGFSGIAIGSGSEVQASEGIALQGGKSLHNRAFTVGTTSTKQQEVVLKFANGYTFYSNPSETSGVTLTAGSGTWASVSDINMKTNIEKLNYIDILNKYKSFDISKWSYKSQTVNGQPKYLTHLDKDGNRKEVLNDNLYHSDIFHIGIMSQDFYSAFGLGTGKTKITALDVGGVNMAAIKALIEENESLKERLKIIERKLLENK